MNRVIRAFAALGLAAALVATAACDPDGNDSGSDSSQGPAPTADPAADESVRPLYAYVARNDIVVMDGDRLEGIDAMAHSLEPLLELVRRQEKEGQGDAPWPPHYAKAKGEPPRVAPSRQRPTGRPPKAPGRGAARSSAR